ncbi:MAG: hypothetical protein JXR20_06765 [Balneola sp.]
MAAENYRCPGCGKLRKAPLTQDIARCRICNTTVEKIDGIWLETIPEKRENTFNVSALLIGVIFIILGFFTIVPIVQTNWAEPVLDQSFLFWGVVSLLVISTITLIIGIFEKRGHAYLFLCFSMLFVFSALVRLSFVEENLPLMQSSLYNPPQSLNTAAVDSSANKPFLYTAEERRDLTELFFELMTEAYLVDDIDNSSNLNVKKTFDNSEKNYDYEITPSETNNRFPASFHISIRDVVEDNLQSLYYKERTGGLGLKIAGKQDAIILKNEVVNRFEENYDLFESNAQSNDQHWIAIQGSNYFYIRFLTLDEDFMILEIIRYMNDADARQHKRVMDQVTDSKTKQIVDPKPLSPQEALACKKTSEALEEEKRALDELELRLAYLDFGDPKSAEHISKENLFNDRSRQYRITLKNYNSGCSPKNAVLNFETYTSVCTIEDLERNNTTAPFLSSGNRFCAEFNEFALRLQSSTPN